MATSSKGANHRSAVILGAGRFQDERQGFASETNPRPEFIAIASLIDAKIISYVSASFRRGKWFQRLFKSRPAYGSVVDFALQAGDFDSCYVTGEDIGLPLAAALKLRNWAGRMVCVVHNVTPKKARLFKLIGQHRFAALIVVSERQRLDLINLCGIPPHKVVRVYNWVDTQYFKPSANDNVKPPVVMACGAENRDYNTLMLAAGLVAADFDVYAHGFFKASGNAEHSKIPNVRRMPRVSFDELRNAYQKSNIVVIPLNDVDYAAGVTGLVEAMACGRPIVVTKTAGISDYLTNIDESYQVAPANPDDMARALNEAANQSDDRNARIGESHRAWAIENCDLDKYARRVEDLLVG